MDDDGTRESPHQRTAYRNSWQPFDPDERDNEGGQRVEEADWTQEEGLKGQPKAGHEFAEGTITTVNGRMRGHTLAVQGLV